jgi:transposase
MVTDANGIPLAAEVSPGQCHESTRFEETMNAVRVPQPVGRPRQRPEGVAGDKGYSCGRIREWLKAHRMKDVIPTKANETPDPDFDKEAYRRRNVIERCIGWLKHCRRVLTRFEKLAVNFLAMLKLAMIRQCFRVLSDTT